MTSYPTYRQKGRGEMLLGPRFQFPEDLGIEIDEWSEWIFDRLDVGQGNTIVFRAEPVAGPIYLGTDVYVDSMEYFAECASCGESSKNYKRRHTPGITRWAHDHRCPRKQEES